VHNAGSLALLRSDAASPGDLPVCSTGDVCVRNQYNSEWEYTNDFGYDGPDQARADHQHVSQSLCRYSGAQRPAVCCGLPNPYHGGHQSVPSDIAQALRAACPDLGLPLSKRTHAAVLPRPSHVPPRVQLEHVIPGAIDGHVVDCFGACAIVSVQQFLQKRAFLLDAARDDFYFFRVFNTG
jgi:hypothetical protein